MQPEIAIDALRLGDLASAWSASSEGIRLATNSGSNEFWQFRFVHAEVLRIRGGFEEALNFLEQLGSPPEIRSGVICTWKMHRGYCEGVLARYGRSKLLLDEAESEATRNGLLNLRCEVLLRQAMVAFLRQDYSTSIRIYRQILEECARIEDWYIHSAARAGVGKVLMIQREFAEAIPWFKEALAIVQQKHAKYAVARLWSEIAVCELGLGRPAEALRLFEDAERVNLELGAMPNYQICVANIGNVYCHNGNWLKAIEHYQRALKIAHEIKDPVSIYKWSHNIEVAFSKLKEQSAKTLSST